jgi:hypothetical protein
MQSARGSSEQKPPWPVIDVATATATSAAAEQERALSVNIAISFQTTHHQPAQYHFLGLNAKIHQRVSYAAVWISG